MEIASKIHGQPIKLGTVYYSGIVVQHAIKSRILEPGSRFTQNFSYRKSDSSGSSAC